MNQRINFNKDVYMHLACAKDDFRSVMQHIYFKDGFAYASDAHILVKNDLTACSNLDPDQIELLDGKLLHADHYKNILKYDTIVVSEEGIEAKKDQNKAFFYFTESEKYPNAEKVLNDALNHTSIPMSQIGFDVKLIQRISKALCTDNRFKFTFKGEGAPVICENLNSDYLNCIGIIMPQMIDGIN